MTLTGATHTECALGVVGWLTECPKADFPVTPSKKGVFVPLGYPVYARCVRAVCVLHVWGA